MNRRAAIAALAAFPASAVQVQGQTLTEYGDSTITNATAGLRVLENGVDDFSLKIISAAATKNVTIVRYQGRTAWADVQLAYQHMQTFLLLLRLDV